MRRVERWREQQLRDDYLLLLYEKQKAANYGCSQSNKDLCDELGIEYNGEATAICHYLKGKGWIDWEGFAWVNITLSGRERAEQMEEERFVEKEARVLQMLLDQRQDHPNGFYPQELATALNSNVREVMEIINELEAKGWAGGSDETTWILPPGIKELQKKEKPPTPQIAIYNPSNSPMSFGDNNNQTVNYTNQSIEEIVPALTRLIEDVRGLDFATRDDVLSELEKVKSLTQGEMNAGSWKLIQSRLLTAKTAMEVVQLSAHSLPYWPAVWHFFFS